MSSGISRQLRTEPLLPRPLCPPQPRRSPRTGHSLNAGNRLRTDQNRWRPARGFGTNRYVQQRKLVSALGDCLHGVGISSARLQPIASCCSASFCGPVSGLMKRYLRMTACMASSIDVSGAENQSKPKVLVLFHHFIVVWSDASTYVPLLPFSPFPVVLFIARM